MTPHPPPPGVDEVGLALTGARRIAVVGLSPDPSRHSHRVAATLQGRGCEIVPVNPTVDEVLGEQAWPDLASVPGRIDVVDVFRAEEHLAAVAEEAVARDDVAVVWNQLGLRSSVAAEVVRAAGRAYVEDRCLMVEATRAEAHPPSGPRIEAEVVLVDLDGTVLDYGTAEQRALTTTLDELGAAGTEGAVDAYRRINADHWAAFERGELTADELKVARWRALVADRGINADGERAARRYLALLGSADDLLAGAREALWWLRRRAVLVAVTNGFDDVQRGRLASSAVDEQFDGYVSSEVAGVAKPDPAMLDAALATVGRDPTDLDPGDLVVVGDSLRSDIALGEAVGARTVWVAPSDAVVPAGDPRPDHHVQRLADIA